MIVRTTELTIQENRGHPRLWLEGRYLEKAGFEKGSPIKIIWLDKKIIIAIDESGEHVVSGKKTPIIDINNEKIRQIFHIANKVRVIVKIKEILVSKTKKDERKESQLVGTFTCGEIFAGGGLFSQATKEAGFKTMWAIEKDENYANIWQDNHQGTMHNSCISDVKLEELQQVELLVGGIPCQPFSKARRNQGKDIPETHEDSDLSLFFLMVVEQTNPRIIILEEVPQYVKSGVGVATIRALERMGYNVEVRMFSGNDFGELQNRTRAVIVACMGKIVFPQIERTKRMASEILLPHDDPRCEWWNRTTKGWVFDHWETQKAKGNNFQAQIITPETESIQAITRRYFAIQPQNPVVKHPFLPETYRLLTVYEVKKLLGLPDDYDLGVVIGEDGREKNKTIAGETLGQGIIVTVFRKIVETVTRYM